MHIDRELENKKMTNEMIPDDLVMKSILGNEYYSCEYIEHGINFYHNSLVYICCYQGFIKEEGIIVDLSKDVLTPEIVIQKKIDIIIKRKNNILGGCANCPRLSKKKWRNEWKFALRIVVFNHYLACNLTCKHCGYIKYRDSAVDTPYEKILDSIKTLEKRNLINQETYFDVGGGEPSINKGIDTILSYYLPKGYKFHINSNGSKYKSLYSEWINNNQIHLTLTPDAGKHDTYKTIKGVDLFNKVWENIGKYSLATNGNIDVKLILQEDNLNEISDFVSLCKKYKVNNTIIDIDICIIKGSVPEKYYESIIWGIKYSLKINYPIKLGAHWPREILRTKYNIYEEGEKLIINNKYCCLCEQEVDSFLPFSATPKVFTRELQIIGSDIKNFWCPNCGCHDRERHLWLYINKLELFNAIQKEDTILYFAPEKILYTKFIQKSINIIAADANPNIYKETAAKAMSVDIQNIPFMDSSFDILIANHVLEHIPDYKKAIKEIKRVLKPGGSAILQTPYSPVIYENFEDPFINTDELRTKYYGQHDHVRIFGQRLFDDFIDAGFTAYRLSHHEVLSEFDAKIYGVNEREEFIAVVKN